MIVATLLFIQFWAHQARLLIGWWSVFDSTFDIQSVDRWLPYNVHISSEINIHTLKWFLVPGKHDEDKAPCLWCCVAQSSIWYMILSNYRFLFASEFLIVVILNQNKAWVPICLSFMKLNMPLMNNFISCHFLYQYKVALITVIFRTSLHHCACYHQYTQINIA